MEGLGFGFTTPKESTASTQEEPQIAKSVHQLQLYFNIAEKGCGGEIDKSTFHQTCCGATALLLSLLGSSSRPNTTEKFSQQLVRLLCRCPAYIFSIDAMETGVYIWNWLVSDAPQLESLVLEELVDAWLWTVDTKRGLFANEMRYSGPAAKLRPHLAPGEPEILPDKDPVEEIVAHQLWLGFFTDRFEVSWHSSVEQLKLLGRLLQGTMKDPLQFSRHPNAAGTFFSVMLLGLKFCSWQCQANLQEFKMDYHLLQDQVYRASLGWFAKNPGWHETKIKNFAQNEVQSVLYFIHFLQNEHMDAIQLASSPTGRENKSENSLNDAARHHPVWGKMDDYAAGKEKWKKLLLMLCHHEADRLDVWANPTKANKNKFYRLKFSSEKWIDYKFYRLKFSSEKWIEFARIAFSVDPQIALSLVSRFPAVSALRAEVTLLVQSRETETPNIPDTLPYLFTRKEVDGNYAIFQQLPYREACSIAQGLLFLSPAYKSSPHVKVYILKVLESYSPESVMHFVPQLVQALRYDDEGLVENYLVQAAQRSHIFSHKLIWVLQAELCSSESRKFTSTRKRDQYTLCCFSVMEQSCSFQARLRIVRQRITDGFTPEEHDLFQRESNFFDKITSISTVLFPHPKEERRAVIRRELEKIEMNGDDLYLPTAPGKLIRSIQLDSGTSLQSAAKVPIMITFNVVDRDGDEVDVKPQACIFKVGDDCRQDVLALQVISLLRDIFEAVEINLYLFPYGVLPTGPERGIIEVVPNARSRSQMGEINGGGLYEVFQHEFGPIGSPSFEAARSNFIRSSAGYAVASLLLQTKDRHNGNLLLDNVGRLVHIDFGFILGTSPGGNMRFENAQFKLSHEMTRLLDPSGSKKSETWMHFVSLCVKGYLAARLHMDEIINTVQMMVDSGLPCFSRADSISNLRQRFHPDMNEREAATFMIRTCKDAYNKWTTALYDTIQYWQHGIKK